MTRRIVDIGTTRFTRVITTDEPGSGGAHHRYAVEATAGHEGVIDVIEFAEGPFSSPDKVDGVFNEDLLAMVIDRLQAFNAGPYKCRENAIAITKIEEAMLWLGKRSADRERRGVRGTDKT